MKYKILCALALALTILACGKKASDVVSETLADTLLPSDVTPVDASAESTGTSEDVTLSEAVTP